MARWWCVASTDPVPLQRIVAASLIGLLVLAALDPTSAERSATGQWAWLGGMLLAGLALLPWRRKAAAGTLLGIDASASLHRLAADTGTAVPVDTVALGAWRIGPWQFIRLRAGQPGPQVLAFDQRRTEPAAWAALQRALVRARRHPVGSRGAVSPAPVLTDSAPSVSAPDVSAATVSSSSASVLTDTGRSAATVAGAAAGSAVAPVAPVGRTAANSSTAPGASAGSSIRRPPRPDAGR